MPNYTYTNLKDAISSDVTTVSNILEIINRAARAVVSDLDLRSTKRKTQLSPQVFEQVKTYTAPADMKDLAIIDLPPQVGRLADSELELVSVEEFDRDKDWRTNLVAVSDSDFVKKLLISLPVDTDELVIHEMDSITSDGTWAASGHASNLTVDTNYALNGSASLNFDVAINFTSALLTNSTLEAVDLTDYEGQSLFLWLWVPAIDGLSSVKLRFGSSASDYWEATATTNNEGLAWYVGWNLVRFSWPTSSTGSPVVTAVDYLRIELVGDGSNAASTDWRADFLVARVGKIYDVLYYSKYAWQSSTGTYKENSTTGTDLVNADTEEFDLFVFKGKQMLFADQHLYAEAEYWESKYTAKAEKYIEHYPSERKILTSTYRAFSTF